MTRYKRPVMHFIFRAIGNEADAEEIAQDVFVREYRSMLKPEFRRTTSVPDAAFSANPPGAPAALSRGDCSGATPACIA